MKYHFNFILIALLTIGLFTGVAFAEPVITEYYPPSPVSSYEGVSQTFSVNVTETVDVIWQIDGVNLTTNTSVTSASYTNSTTPVGSHTVKAIAENANGTDEATWTWNVDAIVAPVISDISETDIDTTSATINFAVDQDDAITQIAYSTSSDLSSPSLTTNETSGTTRDVLLSSLSEGTTYYYRIYAYNAVNDSIFSNSSIHNFTTITPTAPSISDISVTDIKGSSATIEFDVNQTNAPSRVAYSTSSDLSSLIWSDWDYSSTTSRSIELTNLNAATKYYYSVFAYNASNESVYTNTSIYDFTTLSSWGNRIWDEAENLANPYTWDARSFSGFFYDLDTGETSESMEITIDVSGREIEQGDLVYTAVPITTEFEYEDWGEYEVIGFMAQKFFAGYTTATDVDIIDEDLSLMSKGILAEVLIDTDDDESVYSGSSLILEEGYTLNIQEVDVNGERVMISLTKDGDEVDSDILSADETYVYEKDLGSVDDVPLIAVHFDQVFSGQTANIVKIDGIFQISDEYTEIDRGDEFGMMEITKVNDDEIVMENEDDIDLDEGDIIELMGKLKIIVADDDVLRFAPFVDMSEPGTYELRGTIAEDENFTWTPLNFEGFYYDIDEGIMSESLTALINGRNIDEGDLTYTAEPVEVSFEHSQWGDYEVIGFMAEKYFAGYSDNTSSDIIDEDLSLMSKGQLSKVLIDDDDDRSVYSGSSLILEEGYALNIQEVDVNGERVMVSLTKDGDEVDSDILSADETYVYEKDLGSVDDVPLIAVHFDQVFSGTETTAVFVEGIFQISDDFVEIDDGDEFGMMEITKVNDDKIVMENNDDIDLDEGDTIDIMGDIQIKVADSSTLRYYPFIEVETKPSESLDLNIEPETVLENDEVLFTVTSRGSAVKDVVILVDGVEIGETDREGTFEYEFDDAGTYTITAEKEGFVSDEGEVEVISPEDESKKITIEVSPEEIFEGTPITISVLKAIGSEPIEGAEVYFDSTLLGETDDDGTISYTPKEPGIHKIKATISGLLDSELIIQVQELAANFVFSDFQISSNPAKVNKEVTVSLYAVNNGSAEGSYTVELYVNNEVMDSEEITLAVNNSTKVELSFTPEAEGTYLVEAGGFSETLEVEKGISLIWYAAGAGALAIAGGAIYLFTQGGGAAGLNGAIESIKEMISGLRK